MPRKVENLITTATHWGNFQVEVNDGAITAIHPYATDADPSPIGQSLADMQDTRVRITQPVVRQSFLVQGGPSSGQNRGREPFVAVSWEQALDLVAAELSRVKRQYGNEAIFAGSYGWASAGTLHRARDNMQRLLNLHGGFTDSCYSYSLAASEALTPHILQDTDSLMVEAPSWQEIATHGELVVLFGGAGLKNSQVSFGGLGPHTARADMRTAAAAGVHIVNISPIREDVAPEFNPDWISIVPNTDTAVMLAIAHTLVVENRYDKAFVQEYCVGFDRFLPYLEGETDGVVKDAAWAARLSGIPAPTLITLARRMAASKTMIGVSWALQRAEHGEQPFWMAVVLAAMLGEIGQPGRGIAFGLNAMHAVGSAKRPLLTWPSLPRGTNPLKSFIPVARIADMLLNPGQPFHFDGNRLTYPDIKLIYWAGGNPFHHHQDINRLIKAWQRPETIIINEPFWTATARYADIVLPVTTLLERNDINFTYLDATITPMQQALPGMAAARSDYEIFAGIAARLGHEEAFTEGRDEMSWLRAFYEEAQVRARRQDINLPDFETFWLGGPRLIEQPESERLTRLATFRRDPQAFPLDTPSGKIEIFSETIAGFHYEDCPGHPAWLPPQEWLGANAAERYPLHLLSNQPKTRLHSQLDNGRTSQNNKIHGREATVINPRDAAARGIVDGDFIRLYNDRGACLSIAVLSSDIRLGVVQLPTGAWYNPLDPLQENSLELHGNPNVLTRDVGSSLLGQGPAPNSTLVEVEKYVGEILPVTAHTRPEILHTHRSDNR